jgi:hypothetical protein
MYDLCMKCVKKKGRRQAQFTKVACWATVTSSLVAHGFHGFAATTKQVGMQEGFQETPFSQQRGNKHVGNKQVCRKASK